MAFLDFVVTHSAASGCAALPVAARTVSIRVPDSLDPYHQQQLRDALAEEFRGGCEALGKLATDKELAGGIEAIQNRLAQSAGEWLQSRSTFSALPLQSPPGEESELLAEAEREVARFQGSLEQPRWTANLDMPVAKPDELETRLGRLSQLLDRILDFAPARPEQASRQECLVQRLLEAIEAGQRGR